MPISRVGSATYGADAAGQGWELSSTRVMILSRGSQKWNITVWFFFLIFPIFPFPYSSHPAAGKTNQPQPIEQNLPRTPCTAKPNGTEPTNIFCGRSVSTSAVQLPTTHPRAFYIPASGWILLKNTAFIDFISQLLLAFFLAIHHQL